MSTETATAQPSGTGPAAVAQTVTGDALIGALPPVNARAVAAETVSAVPAQGDAKPQPSQSANPSQPSPVAKSGRVFDPAVFRANPDGSPMVGRHGRWLPRGGRKAGSGNGAAKPSPVTAETGSTVPAEILTPKASGVPSPSPTAETVTAAKSAPVVTVSPEQHKNNAEAVLRGTYAVGNMLTRSKEWSPDETAEHDALRDSYVAWVQTRPGSTLPPLALFAINVVVFVVGRVFRPKTAAWLCRLFPPLRPYLTDEPATKSEPAKSSEPSKATEPAKPSGPILPVTVTRANYDNL